MAKDFIKTWNGRRLEDWGSVVSKEYKSFQRCMKNEVAHQAQAEGATLVSYNSGHYYQSGFVERNGLYVYFCYESLDRCHVQLTDGNAFYMRTASGPKDYHGGTNHNVTFEKFKETMNRLFDEQERKRLRDNGGVYVMQHTDAKGLKFELVLFEWGVHVRVYSPSGALLFHNEKWPGTWEETILRYNNTRRAIFDETHEIHERFSNKHAKAA